MDGYAARGRACAGPIGPELRAAGKSRPSIQSKPRRGCPGTFRRALGFLFLTAVFATGNGCSVGLALIGTKDPDVSAICIGATRDAVEQQLGAPKHTTTEENGSRVDTYRYETGNEPSGRRALIHLIGDVATLGIWEVHGAMAELTVGNRHEIVITYDAQDRVAVIEPIADAAQCDDNCECGEQGCDGRCQAPAEQSGDSDRPVGPDG